MKSLNKKLTAVEPVEAHLRHFSKSEFLELLQLYDAYNLGIKKNFKQFQKNTSL